MTTRQQQRLGGRGGRLALGAGLSLLVSATAAAAGGPAELAPTAQVVTVSARRLLDIETGRYLDHPVLRIAGGKVVSVGLRMASDVVTYDLGEVTLLPGLIDCHTHLVGGEGLSADQALRETTARAAIEGVANAAATLRAGFTTVRDVGSRDFADVALRDAIASGRVLGPRMLVAVSSLSVTGGHGDWNDLPADVTVRRYESIADGPAEVTRAVRQNLKFGADWIKILVTGGVTSMGTDPQQADYTEEEIRAAVVAARARGKDVAAHAHGTTGILRAVRAGVRSVEHASYLTDEAIAEVKRAGAFIVPNPYTNYYIVQRGRAGGFADYEIQKSEQVYARKMDSLHRAVLAGVQVAYGTDAGVQPHGINARQLSLYVQAGMTPLQALQSATLVAARLLRQEARLGKLQPGYLADIVAVSGDPAADVQTLEQPVAVLKEGALVFWQPRGQGPSVSPPLAAPSAVRTTSPVTPAARVGAQGGAVKAVVPAVAGKPAPAAAGRPAVPGAPGKKPPAPRAGSPREGGADVWR